MGSQCCKKRVPEEKEARAEEDSEMQVKANVMEMKTKRRESEHKGAETKSKRKKEENAGEEPNKTEKTEKNVKTEKETRKKVKETSKKEKEKPKEEKQADAKKEKEEKAADAKKEKKEKAVDAKKEKKEKAVDAKKEKKEKAADAKKETKEKAADAKKVKKETKEKDSEARKERKTKKKSDSEREKRNSSKVKSGRSPKLPRPPAPKPKPADIPDNEYAEVGLATIPRTAMQPSVMYAEPTSPRSATLPAKPVNGVAGPSDQKGEEVMYAAVVKPSKKDKGTKSPPPGTPGLQYVHPEFVVAKSGSVKRPAPPPEPVQYAEVNAVQPIARANDRVKKTN